MKGKLRNTKVLIQTVALVFFILQVTFALQKYMAKPTMTSPGSKPRSSLDKPLLIAVCKTSQFNYTSAIELGYNSSSKYFAGQPNVNILSWTGQHGNQTWNETFNNLLNPGIENIDFKVPSGNITKRLLIPNGLCKVYEGKPPGLFLIFISDKGSSEYLAFISDPAAANSFQLPHSLQTGETIRLLFTSEVTKFTSYNIKLKETSFLTNDGSCVSYPTSRHKSYSDCVDAELREQILPALGCMVPWMSKLDHCTEPLQKLPEHESVAQMLFSLSYRAWGGIQYKSNVCPLPCTLVSTHATFQQSGSGFSENGIFLHFEDDIKVENIVLAYDFAALLVEIGSSLGLWLGKPKEIKMTFIDHYTKKGVD